MAIWIEDKSCIVILAVVRSRPRDAVVYATMPQRGLVEARNGLEIRGGEGYVKSRTRRDCIGAELDCKLVTAAWIAIAYALVVGEYADITKRSKRSVIERRGARQVRHSDRQMVKHCSGLRKQANRRRADGAQAPSAMERVERQLRRHGDESLDC